MTRVLVVDDRDENRYLLRALLQGHGYSVDEARHGAEALARARLQPPDVVVSDLLMPVMDGYTLLRQWKADPQLQRLPFIVYTATYTDPKDERLALDMGADAFIVKPAEPDAFVQALNTVLATGASQSAIVWPDTTPVQTLEQYNAALVRKLEKKASQLQERVAEHEAALRALGASEARFRAVFDHSVDLILLTTAEGEVLAANPAACLAFGLSEQEICARGPSLIDREDPRLARLLAERAAAGHAHGELTMVRGNGSRFPVELTSTLFRDAQGQARASIIARDIGDRLQAEAARAELEAQLRQAQKMEAIGTLAGGVAHDFNNVLAAILGYATLAQQDIAAGRPVGDALAQIRSAGTRARSLVQRILAFARQQTTALSVQPLQPLVREAEALLRGTLPASVVLQSHLPEVPLAVLADATQVQQVLLNLATNAWHALPGSRGHITLGLDTVHLPQDRRLQAVLPPGHYAHLWVSDDGCGMDEATRARMFEPFFTTKPAGTGTGLGLATAYHIVETHHGAISVDSVPGQGSTFHVLLPLADADGAGEHAVTVPGGLGHAAGGLHVLYIDDDETVALLAERLLRRAGYHATTFGDAAQALAAVRADPGAYDAVVTDYNMPGTSGLDVARVLGTLVPGLPVFIGSGYIDAALTEAARALGVRGLLHKERLVEDLLPMLENTLGRPA